MNPPNYFLADLPPEAALTPGMITEACQTLKRNRERYLAGRSTDFIIHLLVETARDWLDPNYPLRKKVLELGPSQTGFSSAILSAGLDNFFAQLTVKNLEALIVQELGHPQRLDNFKKTETDDHTHRFSIARGPELLVHITGGTLPNPTLTSIVLGLLTRSAQFVKCASGASFVPRMFAHSLYDTEPKLGACLEMAEWKGGTETLETALFAEADCVTATGSDETLDKIRQKIPRRTHFLGYGHRVSFGYVTHEALSGSDAKRTIPQAAQDIIAWNQLGCLSPHVFYVETGGTISPERFAEMLAEELESCEQKKPRGQLKHEEAAAIAYRRSFYEIRAAGATETRLWQSKESTAWTVIYENDPRFQLSCLNRFIYVKPVTHLEQALHGADAVHGKISTVGLAATGTRAPALASQLARWGATRICPLGQMQNPPLTWRHDGRPALGDLVTWSDWET